MGRWSVSWPRYSTGFVLIYALALVAWLIVKPATPDVFVAVDNVAQFLGLLLVLPLCVDIRGWRTRRRAGARPRPAARSAQRWAPMLLGLSVLSEALGQIIYTIYEDVSRVSPMPFPSWADPVYLSLYPSLLLGILFLPARRLPRAVRARVLLDGLMIMAAIVTFSWYFIVGPTVLQSGVSSLGGIVGAAYPLCDLVLIACLLLLSHHLGDRHIRAAIVLLVCALSVIVVTDSIYDIQQLHSAYATGELLDVGWPLGYMLLGLAARALRLAWANGSAWQDGRAVAPVGEDTRPTDRPLWRVLLPYAVLLPVTALVVVAVRAPGDVRLATGVYIGGGTLAALVVARQLMALLENNRLYRETVEYARNLEALNREVRETYDSNRALKEANALLETTATTDPLTGLPNRLLLHNRLGQALRSHVGLALLLMDLDRFKEVNDTLGHQVGDVLLQHVATRLRGALRDTDTVARLGGDEFAVLLPATDAAGALQVARALLAALEAPIEIEGHHLGVEGSVGVALALAGGGDPPAATLLRQADVAMYEAKRRRSGYAFYDPAADEHDPERLALMGALRQALAEDTLQLYYQPQVDLVSGRVSGVEALLRWPHPERGFIPPDQFIPLAEQTGLIAPLTTWVLATALRQTQAWQTAGLDLDVSVNLSARTLHDPTLLALVTDLLDRYTVAPAQLTLEITESALMVDPAHALVTLTRLTELGVRIAIDDFGKGYSSLDYLKRLPVDEVKIDKSFVLGLGDTADVTDAAIVRAVVAIAHALDLRVVAEGVETPAAWERLRALGCTLAQGYYLTRPLPAPELEQWLKDAPWGAGAALDRVEPRETCQPSPISSPDGPERGIVPMASGALICGVVVRDATGLVVDANATAEEILGRPLVEMRGRPLAASLGATTREDGSPLPLEERPVTNRT